MKIMIVSDIHGDIYNTREIVNKFKQGSFDKLIVLGDIGSGYSYSDDKELFNILSQICPRLVLLKGNCDYGSTIDFSPISLLNEYCLKINDRYIYFNHGHQGICNKEYNYGDIYCHGHTHVNCIIPGNIIRCCPGSISHPRGGSVQSYMIIDDHGIYIYNLQDEIINKLYFEVNYEKK